MADRHKIMQERGRGNRNYENENIRNNEQGEAQQRKYFFQWQFDSIPDHGLPLRGFAITLIGRTTLSRTPLDE